MVLRTLTITSLLLIIWLPVSAQRRNKRLPQKRTVVVTKPKGPDIAFIVDERLSLLRSEPGFDSQILKRISTGRAVTITASREVGGVLFYKLLIPPDEVGWIQAEAVVGKFRKGDDERLARLIQASEGFEQIERGMIFYDNYPASPLRPAILLLLGDLIEEAAVKLSDDAGKRLDRKEMAASGAPLVSFYLNFNLLDRYKRLGIKFVLNQNTLRFHYEGAAWRELAVKYTGSPEAQEAQVRLDSLKEKMSLTKPAT
jgi:hypothetical protein